MKLHNHSVEHSSLSYRKEWNSHPCYDLTNLTNMLSKRSLMQKAAQYMIHLYKQSA